MYDSTNNSYENSDGLITNGCVNVQKGKTQYSEGTFECTTGYTGCLYCIDGRCVYNVATIQIPTSRACHEDIMTDLI